LNSKILEKYEDHPSIRPLIREYESYNQELSFLKKDLHTTDNIDALFAVSEEQSEVISQIKHFIRKEEQFDSQIKREKIWNRALIITALIGVGNILLGLSLIY
jgi:hypothetical protein